MAEEKQEKSEPKPEVDLDRFYGDALPRSPEELDQAYGPGWLQRDIERLKGGVQPQPQPNKNKA